MSSGPSDDGELRAEHRSEAARDDWYRYGLSRRGAEDQVPRDALGRPVQEVNRRPAAPDDLFIQYSHETSQRAQSVRTRRGPRFIANVATVVVVMAVGVAAMGLALATSPGPVVPSLSPSPSPLASPTIIPSSFPIVQSSAGPKAAHVAALIDLPVQVAVTDRQRPLDDGGTTLYLTGPKGGVALDPSRGVIRTVLGGAAFAGGNVRRAVLDSGLWISSWAPATKLCGPTCWAQATTYRLDPVGTVTKKLTATYLLGAADDGVWVATGKVVELLDPATGAVLSSATWKGTAEPRIGCGALWSFTADAKATTIAQIDPKTGASIGSSALDPSVTYGPIDVQGRCWMINGSNGATLGSATMAWLNADGTTQATFQYPGLSLVVLDNDFWIYSNGSQMQRVDPTSGTGFGAEYTLPVGPPGGDPQWFFASVGKMWMISGTQLAQLDIPTGPGNAAG